MGGNFPSSHDHFNFWTSISEVNLTHVDLLCRHVAFVVDHEPLSWHVTVASASSATERRNPASHWRIAVSPTSRSEDWVSKVPLTAVGRLPQPEQRDSKLDFKTFHLTNAVFSLTHSILAPTIGVGKNMLWTHSAAYRRREFRYTRTSEFYTFYVFDRFIGPNVYPVN